VTPEPSQPDSRPTSDIVTATLTAVLTIKHADEDACDALAALFLATAWPTARAQNQ
jgi:hypothetical protein